MKSRLEELYTSTLRDGLVKELNLGNVMRAPRIEKIVINIGVKEAVSDSKSLTKIQETLSKIAGQLAVKTRARKSIAGFKLREGVAIGVTVTLRGKKMYDFLDKLINIALPCVRDFQGVTKNFDGNGNYNLGIKDWLIFPEVEYDQVDSKQRGMNITIQTTAHNDDEGRALMSSFSMPFKRS